MNKNKLITVLAGIIALVSCFMMFLPQVTMSYEILSDKGSVTLSGIQSLFGGEVISGSYRLGLFKGATLGFIGYIFMGVAGLSLLSNLFIKNKGYELGSKIVALLFGGVGLGFVWSTKVNFTYLNDLSVGCTKSAFTLTAFGQAYGLIIAIILSAISVVGILYSICLSIKTEK